MNATLRKNGLKMLTTTVTYHMTLQDLTEYFMAEYRYEEEALLRDARQLPKAKILEKVKDYLYFEGKGQADCHVGDNLTNSTIAAVTEIFKERFKEFLWKPTLI